MNYKAAASCLLSLLSLTALSQTSPPAVIDINKAAYKAITLPEEPDFLAADGNTAWVVDNNNNRIQKIAVTGNNPLVVDTIPGACAAPVIAFGAVWVVSCTEQKLYRLDAVSGKVIAKIPTGIADVNGEMSLAAGDGSVWLLTDSSGVLTRFNPRNNIAEGNVQVRPHSYCAAFGFGSVWVSNYADGSVQRIDVKTNTVTATVTVGNKPRFLSTGAGGVWALNQGDGTVTRINPATNKVAATIDVQAPGGGGDITAGDSKVWVVSTNKQRPLQTINPVDNTVSNVYLQTKDAGKVKVDGAARAAGKYVWVSNMYSKLVWVFKQ